ncbi:ABC transporter permease [Bradyrhizobium sp. NP1]|uniref:ABC transporter permease n=1 Tax=Bradyrhizobium sp. NP1 TaxID=3049772 RepID=UPI0025A4D340|nr:ABC transporter permease [Bradyrhizobium sp. NP1]WJR80865.1 ABC transporter permease [Bradyrhizobium sp. NP1]
MATFAVLVALWFVVTSAGIVTAGRFPSPRDFWLALVQISIHGYAGGQLFTHALHSLLLVVAGFLVAVLTGVPLGLWMGWSRRAEAAINPAFLIIRPIPPLAWIPLAILWLGLGDAAKIMVIWFAAFVPSVINTFSGVRTIDRPTIEAARMLGTPSGRFVAEILIPAASPMIFTGLRLSLQAAWTTLVAAELVGALVGLGFVLNMAQQDIYPGMILVGMLAVGVLGFLTTRLLGELERRALAWNAAAGSGR